MPIELHNEFRVYLIDANEGWKGNRVYGFQQPPHPPSATGGHLPLPNCAKAKQGDGAIQKTMQEPRKKYFDQLPVGPGDVLLFHLPVIMAP